MCEVYESDILLDGAKLRRLRKEHGFTQAVLAELIGMSNRHISDLERGKSNNILLKNAVRLSIVLDVDINDLITEAHKKAE